MMNQQTYAGYKKRHQRERQSRRLYVACFTIFLIVATFERLLPKQWRSKAAVAKGYSIKEQAKEQADTFVPYLFMNY